MKRFLAQVNKRLSGDMSRCFSPHGGHRKEKKHQIAMQKYLVIECSWISIKR
jgi:hypothetical protein